MIFLFPPPGFAFRDCGSEKSEEPGGEGVLGPSQIQLVSTLAKILPACREQMSGQSCSGDRWSRLEHPRFRDRHQRYRPQ